MIKLLFETQMGEWLLALIERLLRVGIVPIEDL
jgi:hypothetical protein